MKISSIIPDLRIQGTNVLIELTIGEYLKVAKDIISNNDFQRKKVIKGKVREFLKRDLLIGCTIPPIVLAIKDSILPIQFDFKTFDDEKFIVKCFEENNLLILDGLQRTHVLLELEKEIKENKHQDITIENFNRNLIRAEIYIGLNKLNILYRMLTLNTGQTTMSTRHLMEILYLEYANQDFNGVKLALDKENISVDKDDLSELKFKDTLDGFNSFLEKEENLIERAEILDNVKTLNNLETLDRNKDLFKDFLTTYISFLQKLDTLFASVNVDRKDFSGSEYKINNDSLFGRTAISIFKKSQAFSGFGATVGILSEIRDDFNIETIVKLIPKIQIEKPKEFLLKMNYHFDYIKDKSKKIGNDQRLYFKNFFRALLDTERDNNADIDKSIDFAFRKIREEFEF